MRYGFYLFVLTIAMVLHLGWGIPISSQAVESETDRTDDPNDIDGTYDKYNYCYPICH